MLDQSSRLEVCGTRLEAFEAGVGPPLLFLGAGMSVDPGVQALDLLSRRRRVIAPSHPGFGLSERPGAVTTVDDLAYFYLDLLDAMNLHEVALVGVSFGAWIAAEMAVKSTARLSKLVMANPLGVKVSDRETRDIGDIFAMTEAQLDAALFSDPGTAARDYASMSDAQVLAAAQNRESLARFGWSPYMHDPKLKGRLHRIDVPTLFLRGVDDGLTDADYTRRYCEAVPAAQYDTIEAAGHLPHLEQPEAFAAKVNAFLGKPAYLQVMDGARA